MRWMVLFLWVVFCFLFIWWYGPVFEANCCGQVAVPVTEDSTLLDTSNRFPIGFRQNMAVPFTGPGADSLIAHVKAGDNGRDVLQITGFYYPGEETTADYETMGFARADNLRKRFFGGIPEDRIDIRSRRIDGQPPANQTYFEASEFSWRETEQEVEETVEELADRILIRFPYGSSQKEYDADVDAYLDLLAKRVIESGEFIRLTGHTDNIGSPAFNLNLGMERGLAIQALLVSKGVPAGQTSVQSMGLSDPIDSNDSEAGRHNNRRVEVRLIANDSSNTN